MSKRENPNNPVAVAVWVNHESEIELVATKGCLCQWAFGLKLGNVGGPGYSSAGVRRQTLDSGRFG